MEYILEGRYIQVFTQFLEDCGFDQYGHIDNDKLEENINTAYANKLILPNGEMYIEHAHYFENDIFSILPYYWGGSLTIQKMPNFIYKPTRFTMKWYKSPANGFLANKDISIDEFKEILEKCKNSL